MDPITHGLIGALTARLLVRKPQEVKVALLCGLVGGLAPDLDVLINSDTNPMLAIAYHRHFTHALIFAPLGGFLVAGLLWLLFFRNRAVPFLWLWLYAFAGYVMHAPVDSATAYGTHWLWPFSESRIAWNNMAIIEPVVTLLVLAGVLTSLKGASRNSAFILAGLVAAYFGFGVLQHHRAESRGIALAESRGHTIERMATMPTPLNLVLWRNIYIADGRIHYDAIRAGVEPSVYEGGSVPYLNPQRDLSSLSAESLQGQDLAQFTLFSNGFVGPVKGDPQSIGDYRYALLPNDSGPLWLLRIDPAAQNVSHADFVSIGRDTTAESWQRFGHMIRGGPAN